jgi:hypothetical protein
MIRRMAVLSFSVMVAGCSGLRDAFTGHQQVVAKAAGRELTAEGLAELLAPNKQVPLRREVLDRVAQVWVDYQLLASALVSGDSLLDSATTVAANWPAVAQRVADRLHDTLIVSRSNLDDAQVDSAFNAGDYRWIHHILVRVSQDTTPEVRAAKRRTAEGYLGQLRRGADFRRLAGQRSEDPSTKEAGGSLGLLGRGVTVRPFEEAAFALQPGALSDVVETAFGYHIIWRPTLEQVRDSFAQRISGVMVDQLDSVYMDSLTNRTGIRVRRSAPGLARNTAENLYAARGRRRVMATFNGGRLRQSDFARWLQAFPPQTRGMVLQAPDSAITEFVKSIARNHMLLLTAERMGIRLPLQDLDSIRESYRRDLVLMTNVIGISAESLAADMSAGSDRMVAASEKVNRYLGEVTSTPPRKPFYEVPPFLAEVLRDRYEWDVSPAGVERALELARELRGPETPAAPSLTPAPRPPMGGAPQAPPGAQLAQPAPAPPAAPRPRS